MSIKQISLILWLGLLVAGLISQLILRDADNTIAVIFLVLALFPAATYTYINRKECYDIKEMYDEQRRIDDDRE